MLQNDQLTQDTVPFKLRLHVFKNQTCIQIKVELNLYYIERYLTLITNNSHLTWSYNDLHGAHGAQLPLGAILPIGRVAYI